MLPLLMSQTGDEVKVARVSGRPDVKKHLEDLGFVEGTPLEVVQAQDGNMIVRIRNSKLAITKEMAEKIMVM